MEFSKVTTDNHSLELSLPPKGLGSRSWMIQRSWNVSFSTGPCFSIGISAPWDQTSQMLPTTPQCLEDAPFPHLCFKHLFQNSWWERSFVLKAYELKTGIKQLLLRMFWRSQGMERSSCCCCCLLELLLGREGWSLLHFYFWGDQSIFSALKQMILPGNVSVWSIRDLLFHAGKQSSLLLVWGKSWFFSLTAKLKNQMEKKPFCLDHAGILFLLLNQIHCSIRCELFHHNPKWNGWFIQEGKGDIHKHLMELQDCSSSSLEILIFQWKISLMEPWFYEDQECSLPCPAVGATIPVKSRNVPCSAGCKWWESVDYWNGPILPSFPFLNALRTSFQPFQHSSHWDKLHISQEIPFKM